MITLFKKEESKQQFIKSICNKIGQILHYKSCSANTFINDDSFLFLTFSSPNQQNLYLNLFIVEKDNEYMIYHLNLLTDSYSIMELTEKENEKLKGYQLLSYCDHLISAKQIFSLEESATLATPNDYYENIVADRFVTSKRKKISEIIQRYIFANYYEKSNSSDISEELKKNFTMEVMNKVAKLCMYAKEMNSFNISIAYEDDTVLKAMIFIKNEKATEKLPVIFDKKNAILYYCHLENGVWVESLLPESIKDVSDLFKE